MLVSRRSEPPGAAFRFVQVVYLEEGGGHAGDDDELGDAFAGLHGPGLLAVVVEGDPPLAPVVGIHDAHLVGRGQIPLGGQAGAGEDQSRPALRDGHGIAQGDHHGLVGSEGHGPVGTGVEIRPGGARRGVGGEDGPLPETFDRFIGHGWFSLRHRRHRGRFSVS